jgi:hypothetical protein
MQPSRLDELIRAERAVAPDAGADARIWAAIEHRLTHGPPPPEGVEAGAGTVGGAAGKATLLKVAAGVALIAAGVAGLASRGEAERPVREDMPVVAAAVPAPEMPKVDVPKIDAPTPAVALPIPAPSVVADVDVASVEAAPKKSATSKKKAATKPSEPAVEPEPVVTEPAPPVDFQAELGLIKEIRGALKRAKYAEALELVDEHVRRFGARGSLVQERMFLEYLSLCALDRVDAAGRVAEELKKEWPDSTHVRHLDKCPGK